MLKLSHWPYIKTADLSGELKTVVTKLLTENDRRETAGHSIAVAKINGEIALRFGLAKSIASVSALLHDVSDILKPKDMFDYAVAQNWDLDEAEIKYPSLLHQRLSAVFARDLFKISDIAVLSAIACHSTLKANPSAYDMALFIADKLSWKQAPFHDLVSSALEHSLEHASLAYINFVLNNDMLKYPHSWLIEAKEWLENFVIVSNDSARFRGNAP